MSKDHVVIRVEVTQVTFTERTESRTTGRAQVETVRNVDDVLTLVFRAPTLAQAINKVIAHLNVQDEEKVAINAHAV